MMGLIKNGAATKVKRGVKGAPSLFTKPSNSIAKAKSEKPVVHKRNVVPRKPKVSITIEEFLALDAMLRKHNHGKNALNRREILDKIFTLVI